MGGRAFIVTQSIKKLRDTLKDAVFNDYDYKLLSDDTPVTIQSMKEVTLKNGKTAKRKATGLTDSAKEILAISHNRYKIEDCFRIMKTNFDGRPINHRLPTRIKAHFLICYTALLVLRLVEKKPESLDFSLLKCRKWDIICHFSYNTYH